MIDNICNRATNVIDYVFLGVFLFKFVTGDKTGNLN